MSLLCAGIRHFALLKLIGSGPVASGTVELFPLNGKHQNMLYSVIYVRIDSNSCM